jgi:hypothetical protein
MCQTGRIYGTFPFWHAICTYICDSGQTNKTLYIFYSEVAGFVCLARILQYY